MDFYPEFKALLKKQEIHEPTAIQKATKQPLLDGENIVGLAKTGTGKTLAFALPMLLQAEVGKPNCVVIFEPTTELAIQVRDAILPFAKQLGLTTIALVGAGNRQRQLEVLKKKHPEVMIATPGRFFDLMSDNKIHANQIKHLVIDEADDILEATKLELLASLGQNINEEGKIALFGATESQVTKDADEIFDEEFTKIDVRNIDESRVEHLFLQVDNRHKTDVLTRLSRANKFAGIVFFNSIKSLEHFSGVLSHTNISFTVLSNAASKQSRKDALQALEKRQVKMLLATDLAARGLDIPKLTYVVNYELPEDLNTYTHRAGRTGRVGRSGYVVSLGTDHDFRDLKKVLEPSIEISRGYFDGYGLTKDKPEYIDAKNDDTTESTKDINDKNSTSTKEETTHSSSKKSERFNGTKGEHHSLTNPAKQTLAKPKKKKRKKNDKNKGYHPHGAKKKEA